MKTLPIFAAACMFAASSSAPASLLVYEGYNGYSTSGTLNGQTPVNTTGLKADTAITGGGTTTVNFFTSTGLSFSNLLVSGGAGRFNSANSGSTNAQSYIGYTYTGASVTGTLYTAHLVKIETAQTNGSIISLRANLTASAGSGTSYFVTMADTATGTKAGNQYDASGGATSGAEILSINTTYLVIGRFTNAGTALSGTVKGQGTTFILTEAQFDHFKSGGFTDDELDNASIGTNSINVFSRVKDADVASSTHSSYPSGFNNFTSGLGIQFATGNAGATIPQTVTYDEIRYGTSLDDVLPTGPPPEPVAVSLTVTSPIATEPTAAHPLIGRITLNRLDASTNAVTVNFTLSGSATQVFDYNLPTSATIPANASSAVIEIRPIADRRAEPDETVTLTLSPGSSYSIGADSSATVTIQDGPFANFPTRLLNNLSEGKAQKIVLYGTSLTAGDLWRPQLQAGLDASFPALTTIVNSGGSGMNSVWGVTNLKSLVINQAPDCVFIEFAVNDAVNKDKYPNITPAEARANLNSMINSIQTALPDCEIILQVMNPVIGSNASYRGTLVNCQQNYRDVGKERGLLVIDHMPAWQALLDQGKPPSTPRCRTGCTPVPPATPSMSPPSFSAASASAVTSPPAA